jgi:hypothetical protein
MKKYDSLSEEEQLKLVQIDNFAIEFITNPILEV